MGAGVFASFVDFGTDLGSLELFDSGHTLGDLGQLPNPFKTFEDFARVIPQVAQLVLIGAVIVGIAPDAVDRLSADIVNLSNNPQKLDPPHILTPERVEYEGKTVLILQVPASPQVLPFP